MSWPWRAVARILESSEPPFLPRAGRAPSPLHRPLHTCQIEIVRTAYWSLRPIMAGRETGGGWRLTGESQANAQASALQRVARRLEARQINARGPRPPEGDDGDQHNTSRAPSTRPTAVLLSLTSA